MIKDKYGQLIFSDSDLIELYLSDPNIVFSRPVIVDKEIKFPDELELMNIPNTVKYVETDVSVENFDDAAQQIWYMPDEYKTLDIAQFVLNQCQNDEELQRAGQELLLYQERNMFVLLQYLKYLVDTMRDNNIVWGVGRGSSVASFVLFLLGVHKINSLFYQLDIDEFLK
jgi:DNA polymerase III alpha subunit